MADKVDVAFSDAVHSIPGGFYEFAKRYQDNQGELYHALWPPRQTRYSRAPTIRHKKNRY